MTALDWTIVGLYFVATLGIGLFFKRRAERGAHEFFLSGRSLPWWLAGTSMVATTFAADTPLAVTGIIAKQGVAGNWLWWAFLPGGLATAFFFAGFWRRSRVVTDAEIATLRYSGRPARWLRGFRAVYFGIIINGIIMGWVNLAMAKILEHTLDIGRWEALAICLTVTVLYSVLSGLWGIVVTDLFQFIIGMGGTLVLAVIAMDAVGGLEGLREQLSLARHPETHELYSDVDALLSIWPSDAVWSLPVLTFAVFLTVNWWASWYPGNEPGGGGYIAQRMAAAKSPRHAQLAAVWFNIAHYALRPWPWILVGLCGIALYGRATEGEVDSELFYVQMMTDHLPPGLLGLLMAAFAAAYMSTISTSLNWGASYLINDLYRPFIRPDSSPQRQVAMGRIMTIGVLLASLLITAYMSSIAGAWRFLLSLGAGTGPVLILRWYHWRINAWSEISAMVGAFLVALLLDFGLGWDASTSSGFAAILMVNTIATTILWVSVTACTRPEPQERLLEFLEATGTGGPGWHRVNPNARHLQFGSRLVGWVAGLMLVYGLLFGIGECVLNSLEHARGWWLMAAVGGVGVAWALKQPAFADDEGGQ